MYYFWIFLIADTLLYLSVPRRMVIQLPFKIAILPGSGFYLMFKYLFIDEG